MCQVENRLKVLPAGRTKVVTSPILITVLMTMYIDDLSRRLWYSSRHFGSKVSKSDLAVNVNVNHMTPKSPSTGAVEKLLVEIQSKGME